MACWMAGNFSAGPRGLSSPRVNLVVGGTVVVIMVAEGYESEVKLKRSYMRKRSKHNSLT